MIPGAREVRLRPKVRKVLEAWLQQIESVPMLGRTWMCARIRDAAGATYAGLKGSVTRVAHAHDNETPNVVEFKASMTRQDLSAAFMAALKEAGWQFDPAAGA